jgi:hypothetical protein
MRVPSPRHTKQWLEFWRQYKIEKQLLAPAAPKTKQPIKLDLMNTIIGSHDTRSGDVKSEKKWKEQARRTKTAKGKRDN